MTTDRSGGGRSRTRWLRVAWTLLLPVVGTVSRVAAQITVTPDGGSDPNRTAHTTSLTTSFTVARGPSMVGANLVNLSCATASVVVSCSVAGSIFLAPNASTPVTVTYDVGNVGSGTVTLRASALSGTDDGFKNVPVVLPAGAPRMSALPYLDAKQDYGRCAASCFAAVYAQSTVPYTSLDTPRNVTLVYREDRVMPKPFVLVDVAPDSTLGSWPDEYQLRVKINGVDVVFMNGESTLRFSEPVAVPNRNRNTYRIGGQFTTGAAYIPGTVHPMEILVTAKVGASTYTNRWVTQYLHLNDSTSSIARGWNIAGLQRAYVQADGSLLITEGDGSAVYFKKTTTFGVSNWLSPAGEFSTLKQSGTTYIRAYSDSTKILFSSTGLMLRRADRWGSRDTLTYDGSSRLTQIKDPLDNITTLAYDVNGLRTVTDPSGRITTDSVAPNKTLLWIKDPDGLRTTFGYDGNLRLQTIADRNNKTATFAYDPQSGLLTSVTAASVGLFGGGSASPVTTLGPWQKISVPYTATAGTPFPQWGIDTIYAKLTEPGGAVTRFSVNRWGSPVRTISALASGQRDTTTVRYNTSGLPVRIARPGYGPSDADSVSYNVSGLPIYVRQAGRSATLLTYAAFGQIATAAGSLQDSTTYFRGANGRVDSVRVGTKTVARIPSYDAFGRALTVRRPNADTTTYVYYASGTHRNLNTVTSSGNRTTTYRYDTRGRAIAVAAPLVPVDSTDYDIMNRTTARRQRTAGGTVLSTLIQYDSVGNVTQVTDPKSQIYKYRYNALGWLIRQEDPAGKRDTLQYSIDGDLRQQTTRRNLNITFTYDSLHRVVQQTGTNTLTYSYPNHGLQVTGSSPIAVDTVNFNLLGQPTTSITRMAGQRYLRTYHYTSSALQDSLYVSGGISLPDRGYAYNTTLGILTGIKLGGATTILEADAALQDSARSFPGTGGTVKRVFGSLRAPVKITGTGAWANSTERWVGFDQSGRISQHLKFGGTSGRFFVYDSLGRLKSGSDSMVTSGSPPPGCPGLVEGSILCHGSMTWSSISTPAVDTFDVVGNRIDHGGTYGPGTNRITAFNGCTYKTDAAGSDSVRTCGATTTNFVWNAEGQLTGLAVTGQPTITFDYDAFGRLVRKTSGGSPAAYLLWDGSNLLAELTSTGTGVVAEYSYYPGMDRLHALVVSGTRYYGHADGLGNVIALTDEAGALQRFLAYDDWGQVTSSADPSGIFGNKDRARWKGALWFGPETDIYYMRNRWYEPATGRFISEDPLGLAGGINPTVFAGGNPVDGSDPDGLCKKWVWNSQTSTWECEGGGGDEIPGIDVTVPGPKPPRQHPTIPGHPFDGDRGTGNEIGASPSERVLTAAPSCGSMAVNALVNLALDFALGGGLKVAKSMITAAGAGKRYGPAVARQFLRGTTGAFGMAARSGLFYNGYDVGTVRQSLGVFSGDFAGRGLLQGTHDWLKQTPFIGSGVRVIDTVSCYIQSAK